MKLDTYIQTKIAVVHKSIYDTLTCITMWWYYHSQPTAHYYEMGFSLSIFVLKLDHDGIMHTAAVMFGIIFHFRTLTNIL